MMTLHEIYFDNRRSKKICNNGFLGKNKKCLSMDANRDQQIPLFINKI